MTTDEWFFVTTLYGEMTFGGQRTHIRRYFPMFLSEALRDIRNFNLAMLIPWKLRSHWMRTRLCGGTYFANTDSAYFNSPVRPS